jgi:hypothetical protein
MHESDAMEFIELVLLPFLSRVFDFREGEEPDRYEPHLKKIRAFIKDQTGFWVKEKALEIVHFIEYMETQIQIGNYEAVLPETCVDTVLYTAQKKINETVKAYRLKENPNRMSHFFPLPVLPKKK